MKNKFRYLASALLLVTGLGFSGCEKDETDNISKVTTYPVVTLEGERVVAIAQGGTFTDPGAKSDEAGTITPAVVSGTVNPNTPGVYILTYTGTNSDGFIATATRTVAVTPPGTVDVPDLEGKYLRGTAGVANVKRIGVGTYVVDNPGGVPEPTTLDVPVVFFQTGATTLNFPKQMIEGVGVSDFIDEKIETVGGKINLKWKIIAPSALGASERVLVKQ